MHINWNVINKENSMGQGLDMREHRANMRSSQKFNEESWKMCKKKRSIIEFPVLKVHLNFNMEDKWKGTKLVTEKSYGDCLNNQRETTVF